MLGGKWSMKISHSASPRNRSRRNSRSPAATASVTAGATARALSSVLAATAGPAIGSATDVIWYRFERSFLSPKTASDNKLQVIRMARGCDSGVEIMLKPRSARTGLTLGDVGSASTFRYD